MSFRPVYRGFCRMAETKVPFHPVKSGFGRMGMTLAVIARSKGHPSDGPFFVMFWSRKHIQLGNSAPMSFRHLRSGPSTVSCVPLRGTCLRRTPTHYIRPWVDGSLAICVSRSDPSGLSNFPYFTASENFR